MDPIRNRACLQNKANSSPVAGARQPIDHNRFEGLALALFHESEDALVLFDATTMNILDLNVAAQRLCGISLRNLLDTPVSGLLRSPRCASFDPAAFPGRQVQLPHAKWDFELRTFLSNIWLPVDLTVTRLVLKPHPLMLLRIRTANSDGAGADNSKDDTPFPAISVRNSRRNSDSCDHDRTSTGDTV